MIRAVMPSDVFRLAELAEKMHAESEYKNTKFNKKKIINSLLYMLKNMTLLGFVEERKGVIIGAVTGYLDTYSFNDDYLLIDRGLYVLPEYRKDKIGAKLLRQYIAVGKKLGIKEIRQESESDPSSLDLLYVKVGYKKVGNVYRINVGNA